MQALMLDQLQVVVGGLVGIRAPLRRAPRLMMHYGDLASSERLTIERGHLPTIAPVARPFQSPYIRRELFKHSRDLCITWINVCSELYKNQLPTAKLQFRSGCALHASG
jgi:hypothetical protein